MVKIYHFKCRNNKTHVTPNVLYSTEAVQEARSTTAQQFELERHSLMNTNKKLEMQLKELQGKTGTEGKGMMSAMSDAVAGVVRRTSPSSQTKDKEGSTLEDGMKKVLY